MRDALWQITLNISFPKHPSGWRRKVIYRFLVGQAVSLLCFIYYYYFRYYSIFSWIYKLVRNRDRFILWLIPTIFGKMIANFIIIQLPKICIKIISNSYKYIDVIRFGDVGCFLGFWRKSLNPNFVAPMRERWSWCW